MTWNPATIGRAGALRRIRSSTWSIVLFVVGWLVDFMGAANVPGGSVLDATQANGRTLSSFGAVLALVSIAAWVTVFYRRRAPLLPLVAGAVLLLVGTSYVLFLIGALHALLRWRVRERMLGAVTLIGVGLYALRECTTSWGGALAWLLANDPSEGRGHPLAWNLVTLSLAVASLGLTFGLYLYGRTRGEADSNRRFAVREQRRADELSVEVERQSEREMLARDIHDTLASRLSVLSLQAGVLETSAERAEPGAVKAQARDMREQVHGALDEVRVLLGNLRSNTGDAGLTPGTSLKGLAALLQRHRDHGMAINGYVMVEDADRAAADFQASVYRILQEALTNATKHATGAPVSLHVEVSAAQGARVRVANPLVGSRLGVPGAQQGLNGVRERAAALDGTAWVGAHEGQFIVDVTLPWRERAEHAERV